ncbi:hypothetical protein ACFXKD_27625 [Nocardiopsis aegyptia]|uniref:hypothetical protein n=1 Tax=Nocardiopsis aegyptia TaxID=220378 RepID=UPI00366EE2B8
MILIFTLVGIASGAAAMLPPWVWERRRRRLAEGRLALARAADPADAAPPRDVWTDTDALLADVLLEAEVDDRG